MGITRFSVAGAVTGAALACAAAPAAAADDPPKITAGAFPASVGDNLALSVTGCASRPYALSPNEIFAKGEPEDWADEGDGAWSAFGATAGSLESGHSYVTRFACLTKGGLRTFELSVTVPKGAGKPPATTPPPSDGGGGGGRFSFGSDDVKLTPRAVTPGGAVTITVTCPVQPSASSGSFVAAPRFDAIGNGGNRWEGSSDYKPSLPSTVKLVVRCPGYGSVSYSSHPERTPGTGSGGSGGTGTGSDPTIPVGAPDTGDGSTYGTSEGGAVLPLAGAALALTGGGVLAVRRRRAEGRA
ncbi:hypothetical protein [Actinomadura parmotrematis]|uniref:hypothetical protein n=1 Tax=Actinomadura parmotrematis TaxID=2864039 RepID=UPI00215D9C37|nr:hypothetical protein [Actinomadura parmotrematis]